jgi:hypothetical protein
MQVREEQAEDKAAGEYFSGFEGGLFIYRSGRGLGETGQRHQGTRGRAFGDTHPYVAE